MSVIAFLGTPYQLEQGLVTIVASLCGNSSEARLIAQGLQLRCGVALLSQIQQDFLAKSRGGTGRDGIKWKPLLRSTIAARRTTSGERRAAGVGGNRVRGLLTASQDARWRAIFASRLARLRLTMGEGEARARAAQIAWAILKSEGARTRLEVFGNRQVDTLRDTGELLRSLSPGVEDQPSKAEGQVFQVVPARVIVGTNKKTWHHAGVPGKLPARPLWPLNGEIPSAWMPAIVTALMAGLIRGIEILSQSGPR